jgi:hypothetical protein
MKNLSESVYRSPKWLQKFADFEFRTGEDIKGDPSEKQKEKIRKEEERLRKEREEKERQAEREEKERRSRSEFERMQRERKERQARIEREEKERRARMEFEGVKRERAQREAEENKKREQEKIENKLQDLFNRLVRDFQNAPYSDKIETPRVGGEVTFKYRFENGWTFEVVGNKVTYTDDKYRHGYTVGLIWRKKFVDLANEMMSKQKRRPSGYRSSYDYDKKKSEPSSTYKETPKTGNPQRDRYNLLNDKIRIREEDLKKMDKNDPNRSALENELNSYKRVRDKMKSDYKFENLKTFELFGFGKKKPKNWKDKFDDIYNFYVKNKNKENISVIDIPTADLEKNNFSISQTLDNHLVFYGQTGFKHNWEVVDFSEADIYDPKSTKGVYKITPEEYEKYRVKVQEISDWLDERSEKKTGKSNSSVSDTGLDLDIDEGELSLLELSEKVKSTIELPKSLEFEISYHLWTTESKNELIIERKDFIIDDLKFGYGGGRFWCELFTKDPFGKDAYMWIESDSSHEYFDFEKNKWPYNNHKGELIKIDIVKKEMSRKEERESWKNKKYPFALWYEATPSKWESMEFIKEITNILKEINLGLNKNI